MIFYFCILILVTSQEPPDCSSTTLCDADSVSLGLNLFCCAPELLCNGYLGLKRNLLKLCLSDLKLSKL